MADQTAAVQNNQMAAVHHCRCLHCGAYAVTAPFWRYTKLPCLQALMQAFMARASLRLDSVEQLLSGEKALTPKDVFSPKQSPIFRRVPCGAEDGEDAQVSLIT